MSDFLLSKILVIPAILIAFTVQGYAKARVADKLGDKTPRFQGRLSFNPIAHIDIVGFFMILLCGFGFTKPVQTNPNAYKRGYKDEIKPIIAGPLANLLVGFIGVLVFALWTVFAYKYFPSDVFSIIAIALQSIAYINISLFVLNIIPLPGLAGFDVFRYLSPKSFYKFASLIYSYQLYITIIAIFLLRYILSLPVEFIYNVFLRLVILVVG